MKKLLALILIFAFSGTAQAFVPVVDDFANSSLKDIKMVAYAPPLIIDEFAQSQLKNIKSVSLTEDQPIVDEFAIETLSAYKNIPIPKKVVTSIADEIPVFVSSLEFLTTKSNMREGQKIDFVIAEDVVKNDKVIIPKGTQTTGRVELITMNGAFGTPAELTLGNFTLQNNKNLEGEIKITGANRSMWVYPVGYMTLYFFGAGLLVFAIRGGHAKIKPAKEFELAY